eukprot:scaffold2533_cov266-Chaetoceros_neogracile.AAC.1
MNMNMMDRIVPVKPDIDEKREEQIDYEQKQQKEKPTLTSAALQSTVNGTLRISSPSTGTNSPSTKIINSNARVNGHHDVDDDGGDDDDNVVDDHNVVEKQEQISPQRTSSRRTQGRILSYAGEELEPEISHSEDDGGVTFASTTGVTTTATIASGPCTLTGEEVGTGLGTHMHAESHEDIEYSSRKMDNIGFIQNVEAYNTFISEHGIEPSKSTNKKLFKWHKKLCQAYRMRYDNVSRKSNG